MRVEHAPIARAEMLIRRPVEEVFQAFVDPTVTTKYWFTNSSGPLEPNAEVRLEWEMYGAPTTVNVKEVEENSQILLEWDPDAPREVEWRFFPGPQLRRGGGQRARRWRTGRARPESRGPPA